MDDDAYARRLLAILAAPEPVAIEPDDPYLQAEDRIGRSQGFGSEVVVERVRLVQDGPWPELEVDFRLVPPWEGPATGTVRVLGGAEWLRASGYADPAAYAPAVAAAAMSAAHHLVAEHRPRRRREPRDARHLDGDVLWSQLLERLADEGEVREVAAGRLELLVPREEDDGSETTDRLVLLLTREQWVRVVARQGDWEMHVTETLGPRDHDERYVVCFRDALAMSVREELPPVRGRAEERELVRLRQQYPEGTLGWFASSADATRDRPDRR